MIMCVIVVMTWSENYGNKSGSVRTSMVSAVTAIRDGKYYRIYSIVRIICPCNLQLFHFQLIISIHHECPYSIGMRLAEFLVEIPT